MAALQPQGAVPSALPQSAAPRAMAAAPAVRPAPAPNPAPEPGSANAYVADNFPGEWSPRTPNQQVADRFPAEMSPQPAVDGGAVAAIDRATAPRGIRNNNPLNIEDGNFARSMPGYAGSDGRFAKFETQDQGLNAANTLLDTYERKHGLNTVAGIINRWAPASDGNNVSAYAADVSKRLGIDPNAPVPKEMRQALIEAMGQHENGVPVQVAQAAPVVASDADAPVGAGRRSSGDLDTGRLLAVMQNPFADETTRAIVGKLLLQRLDPGEDTYGVIGEDAFGGKKYGFVNAKARTINGQSVDDGARSAASGGSGGPFDNIDSSKTGDEYLKQFPQEIQAGVKDYIEGRKMPTGNPRRSDIIRQVAGKYGADIGVPADDASFGARRTMLNDLQKTTPGSIGGQITSLRTAANHLATMASDAEDLGNWDAGSSWLSRGVNTIRGLTTEQAAKMEKLKNDALRYGQEITKFYSGSPGGEAERQHFLEALDAAKSPKELAAVIDAERQLIPGRGEELQNRITNTLGPRLAEKYRVHSSESDHSIKEAGDVVKRMRGDPDAPPKPEKKGDTAAAPKAAAPTAPKQISTKAEYDALPSGETYVAPDGSIRTKK